MEIRYPNYYRRFRCIAGDCPDTCCAGWEIPVDTASERRYQEAQKRLKRTKPAFAKKLKKYIKDGRIISEDVICPFLNKEGLCDMYIELGPEALCHTCARHPRHMEDYGNLHEMVLLLSCPEVARLVLEENSGGFYVRNLPERRGDMDGIDEEWLEILLQVRARIWEWNSNPLVTVDESMAFSVALAHDVQKRIRKNDYTGAKIILERYDAENFEEQFARQWTVKNEKRVLRGNGAKDENSNAARSSLMADFMDECSEMEMVCRDWPKFIEAWRERGYRSPDEYRRERSAISEYEADFRKVFEYFVYSFVLSSLYDGDLLTKVKMAILCTMAVEDLYMAADRLDPDMRVNICHATARQVENSDENRAALETFLKQEHFRARRIIEGLL